MSTTDITIEERDAIYDQMLSHLSGVDDLRAAFQAGDFERARRLGIEFADDLRLMEDLGWDAPFGTTIKLTAPPEQLHRVLTRLRADVERLRVSEERDEAEVENEIRSYRERAKRITEACERVLGAVGGAPSPELRTEAG